MIVKLQSSQFSSDGEKRCLIYDRSRAVYYETDKPEEVEPLLKVLNDRPKAYFHAEINKEGKVVIGKEAPQQNW